MILKKIFEKELKFANDNSKSKFIVKKKEKDKNAIKKKEQEHNQKKKSQKKQIIKKKKTSAIKKETHVSQIFLVLYK